VSCFGRTFLCAFLLVETAAFAQPEAEVLRGPHPFIKDNELSLHAGYGAGLGDAPQGVRLQGDYSYRVGQVPWLHIQMGVLAGGCDSGQAVCDNGMAVDILGGLTWKFQTNLPIVPYAKVGAGPVFLFPERSRDAAGLLVRGGGGAHYYPFDWFGLGVEFTGAWGAAFPRGGSTMSLGCLDFNVGVALQF